MNMELPPWLKIENLIGKLNLAGWFKQIHIGHTYHIYNIQNNIKISSPISDNIIPKAVVSNDKVPELEVKPEEINFEFSNEEKIILEKVNQIHKLNNSNYTFGKDYILALQHIRNKSSKDWFNSAALHMANAIQSGDTEIGVNNFLNSFQVEGDPAKAENFIGLKNKISYCYRRLQNLRHVDKSGELKECMISEYHRKISEQNEIPEQDYQQIFNDFQSFLLELFNNYSLKNL